jgi:transposase
MSNPLLVGLDVHRTINAVCVMDRQGQELVPRFVVDNNRPGTQQLVQRLAQRMPEGDLDALHVGAEATGWYWFHLFLSLSQDPALSPWPLSLYPFNPRLTANFKKTYGDLDHTDVIDAFVVADRLPWGRDLPAPFHYDDTYGPLRFLTRYRSHVVHTLARETAYCLAILYLKASEYTRPDTQPFSDVFGVASRAVLKEFASIEAIVTLPFDQVVEFIDAQGKRRFADPTDNARRLQQVGGDSYPLPAALQPPINLILGLSRQHITSLETQQKRLEAAIAEPMATIPHTLNTIPGFGPVFAGGIISEIAGIPRFHGDQAKVAKFAGLKWRRHQSADFQAEETRLTRTGNRYLRYYFCEAANAVRMRDAEYAAYYDRKYHEVRKHQHKRAIVLTARKLVRLVVRLLTTNQPYQPRRR